MPRKLPRPCRVRWCPGLTLSASGYCLEHQKEVWKDEAAENRPVTRFYDCRQWKRLRLVYLTAHPICEDCKHRPATVVDHVVPIRIAGDEIAWHLALDQNNLQSLCERCHNKKRGAEAHGSLLRRRKHS